MNCQVRMNGLNSNWRLCSGSIVPKLEAAMGPRTAAGGAGGQQGFIHRKTALSKFSRLKTADTTADSGTPRGPGRSVEPNTWSDYMWNTATTITNTPNDVDDVHWEYLPLS